jgi:hypothetical protein
MKKLEIFILYFVMLFISSCATTHITSTWKSPDASPRQYNKVMVIGIIREADRTLRERMEEHLVGDIQKLGYRVFSAYHEYGPKAFDNMTETQVTDKLAKEGIDAVITVVLLDKHREKYYVPGRVVYSPYNYYHGRFWGYYSSINSRIYMPGYYQESTKYLWESNFYDLSSGKLMYSVQTQSFDPSNTDDLAHEYGQKIVDNMVKHGLLVHQTATVAKSL